MNFRLSRHAQEEMQRRGIPLILVESVLNNPQQIVSEREGRKADQSHEFPNKVINATLARSLNSGLIAKVHFSGLKCTVKFSPLERT